MALRGLPALHTDSQDKPNTLKTEGLDFTFEKGFERITDVRKLCDLLASNVGEDDLLFTYGERGNPEPSGRDERNAVVITFSYTLFLDLWLAVADNYLE